MNYNWILFLCDDFSEHFKNQMSIELSKQFDLLFEKENAIDNFDFQMIVGLRPINLFEQNENTFIDVDFVYPSSESIPITIGWKRENNNNLNKNSFEFFWTSDLPIEQIKRFIK